MAELNLIEPTTERSSNSVNISLFDIDDKKLIVNNELNLTRLNHIMTVLLNHTPSEWEQTLTNTEYVPIDLTTVESKTRLPTIETDADVMETIRPESVETAVTETAIPSTTTPSSYMPRFINRIAILPIGFYKNMRGNDHTSTPSPPKMITQAPNHAQDTPSTSDAMTTTQAPSRHQTQESNQITTASPPINVHRSTTPRQSRRFDFVVYGILANKTVVRKYPEDIYDDENDESGEKDAAIVYGILANSTVLRKYPNGTTTIDEKRNSRLFEITNIDPVSLFDPNNAIYMQHQPSITDQASFIGSGFNSNNQSLSTNKSTFNLNNFNTTSASFSNNNNANSITAPSTVFKLPIIYVICFFIVSRC